MVLEFRVPIFEAERVKKLLSDKYGEAMIYEIKTGRCFLISDSGIGSMPVQYFEVQFREDVPMMEQFVRAIAQELNEMGVIPRGKEWAVLVYTKKEKPDFLKLS